jgi:hypothetical protein
MDNDTAAATQQGRADGMRMGDFQKNLGHSAAGHVAHGVLPICAYICQL